MRGEYYPQQHHAPNPWELPPRARRIPPLPVYSLPLPGTTSACAENTSPPSWRRYSQGNYLRVRGEYAPSCRQHVRIGELPPRARRIHRISDRLHILRGTTSACAENTPLRPPSPFGPRNYLRVRGEYIIGLTTKSVTWELPPRARRILLCLQNIHLLRGTTSACAENTLTNHHSVTHIGNYLRVRGEYQASGKPSIRHGELPPRARRIRR